MEDVKDEDEKGEDKEVEEQNIVVYGKNTLVCDDHCRRSRMGRFLYFVQDILDKGWKDRKDDESRTDMLE